MGNVGKELGVGEGDGKGAEGPWTGGAGGVVTGMGRVGGGMRS